MTKLIDPHKAVDFIIEHSRAYAQAKANRIHLERFRESKKALLMKDHPGLPVNAQEREALSHPDYLQILDGLKEAVYEEEYLKAMIGAASTRVDIWRTEEASNRTIDRSTQ